MSRSPAGSRRRAGLVLLAVWAALLAGGLLAGLAVEGNGLDGRIVRDVAGERTPGLSAAARLITELGSGWLLPVAALAGAVLCLGGRPRQALVLVVAVAGATFVTDLVKLILERPRPAGGGLVGVASSSWPSGHAASAAAFFGALAARAGRWARAGAVVLVGAVGATRVYLGVHYPSDVIAGWALGGLWLWAVVVVLLRSPGESRPRRARAGARARARCA